MCLVPLDASPATEEQRNEADEVCFHKSRVTFSALYSLILKFLVTFAELCYCRLKSDLFLTFEQC